jgi:hypothetical protein
LRAEPLFERADLLAQRGLRNVKPFSSTAEIKLLGENHEAL